MDFVSFLSFPIQIWDVMLEVVGRLGLILYCGSVKYNHLCQDLDLMVVKCHY